MVDKLPLKLFHDLFERGVGELLMIQQAVDRVLLGNLVMDKGALLLRDLGLMKGVSPAAVAACWDIGVIGAVCDLKGKDWASLTFLGADHCRIPVNLSSTRHRLLKGITTSVGESLIVFEGSVYRGFQQLLDANLLPLVLPFPVVTDENVIGLAVCDFRFATLPIDIVSKVNNLVRTSVDNHLKLSIEEFDLEDSEFEKLFGSYLHHQT